MALASRGMGSTSPDDRPLLLIDIDGVLSLFPRPGARLDDRDDLRWLNVEGIVHMIALSNCEQLFGFADRFDLVWATGWEEKANEHLVPFVGLAGPLPVISFDGPRFDHHAHWKLGAIEAFIGDRPTAWVDDAHDDACREWADARQHPTLLVDTEPASGFGAEQARLLGDWRSQLDDGA